MQFLVYVTRFDVSPVGHRDFDEVTGMHILKHITRASGVPIDDVVPLSQLQVLAPIVLRFGITADPHLTAQTSSYYSNSFYLNHFFDKELYFAIKLLSES